MGFLQENNQATNNKIGKRIWPETILLAGAQIKNRPPAKRSVSNSTKEYCSNHCIDSASQKILWQSGRCSLPTQHRKFRHLRNFGGLPFPFLRLPGLAEKYWWIPRLYQGEFVFLHPNTASRFCQYFLSILSFFTTFPFHIPPICRILHRILHLPRSY